mmetsp:Transcript_73566/g.146305  ORF Transcript_73566/g.146305 Transcript_73566/m.146305 type:complete len:205 (-) Transcript_73566:466-1080(-)
MSLWVLAGRTMHFGAALHVGPWWMALPTLHVEPAGSPSPSSSPSPSCSVSSSPRSSWAPSTRHTCKSTTLTDRTSPMSALWSSSTPGCTLTLSRCNFGWRLAANRSRSRSAPPASVAPYLLPTTRWQMTRNLQGGVHHPLAIESACSTLICCPQRCSPSCFCASRSLSASLTPSPPTHGCSSSISSVSWPYLTVAMLFTSTRCL